MSEEARPSILVVDDDADLRTLYREALGDEGFEVWTAKDGLEGAELLRRRTPDAVVLDMGMPNASGLTVLSQIRDNPETRDLPVVVVTGLPSDDTVWGGRKYDWDHYLGKPVRIHELAGILRALIAERTKA